MIQVETDPKYAEQAANPSERHCREAEVIDDVIQQFEEDNAFYKQFEAVLKDKKGRFEGGIIMRPRCKRSDEDCGDRFRFRLYGMGLNMSMSEFISDYENTSQWAAAIYRENKGEVKYLLPYVKKGVRDQWCVRYDADKHPYLFNFLSSMSEVFDVFRIIMEAETGIFQRHGRQGGTG